MNKKKNQKKGQNYMKKKFNNPMLNSILDYFKTRSASTIILLVVIFFGFGISYDVFDINVI